MIMKQRILTTVILAMTLFSTQSVCAAEHVTSPDGNIVVTIDVVDGKPTYKVALDNVVFLKPSPLGVVMNVIDLTQELEMTACDVSKFEDEYSLKTWKQSQIKVEATKAVCRFEKKGRHVMDIIFMVTNRDVALPHGAAWRRYARRSGGERGQRFRAARENHHLPLSADEADDGICTDGSEL